MAKKRAFVGHSGSVRQNRSSSYYRARYYDPAVGKFLSEDPADFGGGINFYSYVLNRPLNGIDPFGLNTTVIIIYDKGYGGITYGSHAALFIDNGGDPILYDPAGSYAQDHHCGSGDACDDSNANLGKYEKYHQDNDSTLQLFVFQTTLEEEKHIADRIDTMGGSLPFFCASSVSNAIKGIGPFKNLKGSGLPGRLAKQLQRLIPKPLGKGWPFGGGGGGSW